MALLTPFHVPPVPVRNPGLVYVKDPGPLLQLVQEPLGKQLTKHEAALGVALEGHELHSLVAHAKAATKYS